MAKKFLPGYVDAGISVNQAEKAGTVQRDYYSFRLFRYAILTGNCAIMLLLSSSMK